MVKLTAMIRRSFSRPKRYFVLLMVLSMLCIAFIGFVDTFFQIKYTLNYSDIVYGDYTGSIKNIQQSYTEIVDAVRNYNNVEYVIPYFMEEHTKKFEADLYGVDEDFWIHSEYEIVAGEYPKSDRELVCDMTYLYRYQLNYDDMIGSECCATIDLGQNARKGLRDRRKSVGIKLPHPILTENERQRADKHGLTLLIEPKETTNTEHKVSVEFRTLEGWRENVERNHNLNLITDEEYETAMEKFRIYKEKGENAFPFNPYILVDGYLVMYIVPYTDPNYDGGLIAFTNSTMDENGDSKTEELSFESFEAYLDWIRKTDAEFGYSDEQIEQDVLHVQVANEALKTGDYEILPEGTINAEDPSLYLWYGDYRSEWEYEREAVEAIQDSIDEISIYDEEMNREFTVHVTLPPDYDESKTYPVFFLTDGIWRFGNHPALRKLMENGEASPVILASMWYSYNTPYDGGNTRYFDLVINRDKLLNFVTNNLMPYLTENYNIDCANSTLYGHSDGGVFTHYALFNSDKFDNQPFGHYIIGSPALWGLYNYNDRENISSDDVLHDYGYFDRNEKLGKSVFLCAGSQEDPDYADSYKGHDTTLEGTAKLKERLEAHGADLTYKLYDSHHYQYIPEMLAEYLKETYPCSETTE